MSQVISKQVLVEGEEPFHYIFADVQKGLDLGFYVKVESPKDAALQTGIPIEQLPKLNLQPSGRLTRPHFFHEYNHYF